MADISQIHLPNGNTYNFKDTVSGYTKNNGTVTSVATGTGLTGGTITTSGTISIANHSADYISGGYLNIHPENNPTLIPFVNNDIAYLLKRGGSVIVKYDGTTQTVDLSNCFDASPSYWAINQSITTITIELTLHKVFAWTNTIYIDFGSAGWRAKGVKIEVMNTNYPQDVWTQKYNNTNNSLGHCYVSMSHTPVGAANAGGGFNKIRFTLNPNQSAFRIAQIGVYNYGSSGLRETFLPKDGGSLIGSLTPQTNNTYNLGSSNYKWANGYFTNINGVSVGSSPKFTDTTYESKSAASGGTDLSLVTTGEKYNWNNKTAETYSLILLDTLTNTETIFTTYNSRKFSDYDLYIFTFGTSDINIRRTVVLTKSQWKGCSSIDEGILHGASSSTVSSYSYCGIVVKYGSDTSVKAKIFGSGDINKFSVLGIKY